MLSIAMLKFVSANYDFIKSNKQQGKSWDEVRTALNKKAGSSLSLHDLTTYYKLITVGEELKKKYESNSDKR